MRSLIASFGAAAVFLPVGFTFVDVSPAARSTTILWEAIRPGPRPPFEGILSFTIYGPGRKPISSRFQVRSFPEGRPILKRLSEGEQDADLPPAQEEGRTEEPTAGAQPEPIADRYDWVDEALQRVPSLRSPQARKMSEKIKNALSRIENVRASAMESVKTLVGEDTFRKIRRDLHRMLAGRPNADGAGRQNFPVAYWLRNPIQNLRIALRNYKVVEEGAETVAGRRCLRLAVLPLHPHRSVRRFWIDVSSPMILGFETIGPGGNKRAQGFFEEIRYGTGPRVGTDPAPRQRNARSGTGRFYEPLPPRKAKALARTLPGGFLRVGAHKGEVETLKGLRVRALVARYTDGMESLAILHVDTGLVRMLEQARAGRRIPALPQWLARSLPGIGKGCLARAEAGGTTFLAIGTTDRAETAEILSAYLRHVEKKKDFLEEKP